MLPESMELLTEVRHGVLHSVLLASKSSNRFVQKLGKPHVQQYQLTSVCSKGSYNTVGIFKQSLWNQFSQFELATERTVLDHTQAFLQIPHSPGTWVRMTIRGIEWQQRKHIQQVASHTFLVPFSTGNDGCFGDCN